MSFNNSRLPESWCFLTLPDDSERSSSYDQVTVAACVATILLAPMTVEGNALILAAIWGNPSLRTPSYVLLTGLAITDFCTGLLTQPLFAVYKLADVTRNGKVYCVASIVTESVGLYFSSLTFVVIAMIAVERWLHMSRISLLTVPRVVILYITFVVLLIPVVFTRIYNSYHPYEAFNIFKVIFLFWQQFMYLSRPSLISKFFKSYGTIRIRCRQTKVPLTWKHIKRQYLQFCTFLQFLS